MVSGLSFTGSDAQAFQEKLSSRRYYLEELDVEASSEEVGAGNWNSESNLYSNETRVYHIWRLQKLL